MPTRRSAAGSRCPSGSVHFECSGDISGKADFEIDVERTEAAREAEKEQAFAEWLEGKAEEKAQAAASGGGGGCCLIS